QSPPHDRFHKAVCGTPGDFRYLPPLVRMDALKQAGTRVHEPVHRFRLEVPDDVVDVVLPMIGRLEGIPLGSRPRRAAMIIDGELPAARVHELQQRLPGITRGEGLLEPECSGYRPIHGPVPSRRRTDGNPVDRKAYLLGLQNTGRDVIAAAR